MFTSAGYYTPSIDCSHERIFEDVHEGSSTCLDCNRVVEDHLFYVSNVQSESRYVSQSFFSILYDLKELWQLTDNIVQETQEKYKHICKELSQKESSKRLFKKKELLAFAFYITLMRNDCTRLPEEIVCVFELQKMTSLFRIGELVDECCLPSTESFIQRYASIFNFTYAEKRKLLKINSEFSIEASIQPMTKAVIIIFCYSELTDKKLTLKYITDKCFISYMNVKRFLKSYPEIQSQFKTIFNFVLEEEEKVFKKTNYYV